MSNQKPVYLLAGGRGGSQKGTLSIIKTVLRETGKERPDIAYVGVASEDDSGFYKMISSMIKKAGDCNINRVLIASKKADIKKGRQILESTDAVFMSGGDVEVGMQILEEKNLVDYFKGLHLQGKLFFGISAGSIMLAKEWVRWKDPDDDSSAELFACLGLVPIVCDTHAEEDGWEELQALLKLKKANAVGYGIPTDTCLKVFPDGKLEALAGPICRYIHKGDKVEKQPDLVPG